MTIINCSECNGTVSDKATSCPHCGAPVVKAATLTQPPATASEKRLAGFLIFAIVCFIAWFMWPTSKTGPASKAEASESCKVDDLQCLGNKGVIAAGIYCQKPIERLAEHSVRWTDGTLEMKFSRFRWADQPGGEITYVGDKVEFQNGFGAYTPIIYTCTLSKDNNNVLDARAMEGRLP